MRLRGRVAIVTGGAGGLGQGICRRLAMEGADLVVSDLSLDGAEATAELVRAMSRRALAVQTDVRAAEQCDALVSAAVQEFGHIDILVCNAGVLGYAPDRNWDAGFGIENLSEAEWELTLGVNLKGVFLCNRAVAPHFKERRGGKIVNIASIAGKKGVEFLPHYSASKAGVIVFTQAMALQLAPYGVTANVVCPGLIWTPMWEQLGNVLAKGNPEFQGMTSTQVFEAVVGVTIPLGRPQKIEDIANAVMFLASEEAAEITGQAINVDGGAVFN